MQIHRLGENENIYTVASDYSVSPFKLAVVNEVEMNGRLGVGKELYIPTPTRTYTVRRGDEVERIARRFGITESELYSLNPELYGRRRLYNGQLLTVKSDSAGFGMASTNAYYYRGCPESRVELFLPFMNYVTVCSARCEGERIVWLFDDGEILKRARESHKFPLLRVYVSSPPCEEQRDAFFTGLSLIAKNKGYCGVTLANLSTLKDGAAKFVTGASKKMKELGLTLIAECELNGDTSYADCADGCVLTHEKLHECPIPDFDSREKRFMTDFAENHDSYKAAVDLSAFAYADGKYVDKNEAIKGADRQRREYIHDGATKTAAAKRSGKSDIIFENLENIKAKLTLLGELGYMGISYDIARTPLNEIIMFSEMFKPIERGVYYDEPRRCPGVG